MQVRLYDDVHKMPGVPTYTPSQVFIRTEDVSGYEGEELQAFLHALLALGANLCAHVAIQNDTLFKGKKGRVVITSPLNEKGKYSFVFYGTEYCWENGPCIVSHDLDVKLECVAEHARAEYAAKKKDLRGWIEFFADIIKAVKQQALSDQQLATQKLQALASVG